MGILANSEDPDEMPHNAVLYQSLHCLLKQNVLQRKNYNIFLQIITSGPTGDKGQSKTLFLSTFDPGSSIVDYVFACRLPAEVIIFLETAQFLVSHLNQCCLLM